ATAVLVHVAPSGCEGWMDWPRAWIESKEKAAPQGGREPPNYWLVAGGAHTHRGNVGLLDQLIKRRHVRCRDLLPSGELLLQLGVKHVVNLLLGLRGRVIRLVHGVAERIELLVEFVGIAQIPLRTLQLHLSQLFLYRTHLLVELLHGIKQLLVLAIAADA